jgi:hypothetical protein
MRLISSALVLVKTGPAYFCALPTDYFPVAGTAANSAIALENANAELAIDGRTGL